MVVLFQVSFANCYLLIHLIHVLGWSKTITVSPRVLPVYLLLNSPFLSIIIFGRLQSIGSCACFQHKMKKYLICHQADSPFVFQYSTVYCSCKQSLCSCFQAFCAILFVSVQRHLQGDKTLPFPIPCASIASVCSVYCSKKPHALYLSYVLWIPFCLKSFQFLGSMFKMQSLALLSIDLSLICKNSSDYKIIIVL